MPEFHPRPKGQPRLSLRIMLGVGVLVAVVWLVIGGLTYLSVGDEIDEVYDSQLVNSAAVLWSLSRDETDPSPLQLTDQSLPLNPSDKKTLHKYAKWRSYRVWHDGVLVRSTDNVPTPAAPPGPAGIRTLTAAGESWKIYTLYVPRDHLTVEVGERLKTRYNLIGEVMHNLFEPLLLAFPLIMIAIWFGITWGLGDLRRFAGTVRTRSSADLSPIDMARTPAEITPLAQSLNTLLSDLGRSLEQERRFTDNAAHELRTPLATLDVQAEVMINARTQADRRDAAAELTKGVARASRLLDQLLTLARIRHAPLTNTTFNLYGQVRDAIRDIYPVSLSKSVTLSLSGDERAEVTSKSPPLAILLNNILDNAIKFSPPGGAVEVEVRGNTITVRDDGPGIAEAERERVFERFYRGKGVNEIGSGLGLSIVRNIADILPADVSLANRAERSGLIVTVTLRS